jgi:outer membrane protein assembly factor BamB
MKKLVGVVATLVTAGGLIEAQERSRIYSQPAVPPQALLDRLNLKLAWRALVPVAGQRDGIFSIQVLDGQLIAQMRSGLVVALDPETGTTRWRTVVGQPFRVTVPLGHNERWLFAFSGVRLFALSRATGNVEWEFDVPQAPAAPPAADDERIYLPLGGRRLYVYELPRLPPLPGVRKEGAPAAPAASAATPETVVYTTPEQLARQPIQYLWDYEVPGLLEQTPLLTADQVLLADTGGMFFALSKYQSSELYRFQSESRISAPLGQDGDTAFVAANDFVVAALDIPQGRLLWRFTADRLILRKPVVTDEDVFIAPQRVGLYRIIRERPADATEASREAWRNLEADRFLARNRSFVYALDRCGKLVVLDRVRGTILSGLEMRDYVVAVPNDVTDRIYLAANDGLIICLHDRAYPQPLLVRTGQKAKAAAPPAAPRPRPADEGGGVAPPPAAGTVK